MPKIEIVVPEHFSATQANASRRALFAHLRERPAGLAFIELIPMRTKRLEESFSQHGVWTVRLCRIGGEVIPEPKMHILQTEDSFQVRESIPEA